MEEVLYSIFGSEKQFLTKREIISKLLDLGYNEDNINSFISILDTRKSFINIDDYYSKVSRKRFKDLPSLEKIRYIVRKVKFDSSYGNFYETEYKYIKGLVKNELIKMSMNNDIIDECLKYVDDNLDDLYDSDRYIMVKKKEKKAKIIYNKVLYKLKNIYALSGDNNIYYCVRKIAKKDKKIYFQDEKYYHDIVYEYYNLKNNQLVSDSINCDYEIIPIESLAEIKNKGAIVSINDIEKIVKVKTKL